MFRSEFYPLYKKAGAILQKPHVFVKPVEKHVVSAINEAFII